MNSFQVTSRYIFSNNFNPFLRNCWGYSGFIILLFFLGHWTINRPGKHSTELKNEDFRNDYLIIIKYLMH